MKKILNFEDFSNGVNEGHEGLPYPEEVNKKADSDSSILLIHTIPGEMGEEVKYVELNYMSFFSGGYGSEGIEEAVLEGDTIYVVDAANATGAGGFFTKPFSLEDLKPIKVFYNENDKVAVKEF